jgi:MFS family permease
MTTTTATADPIAFTSDAPGTLAPSPAPWVPWLFQAGNLCFWLSLYYYVPTLPNYARDLGAPLTVVGAMLSAYGIVQLVLRIPTGVASDWWGRRKPVFLGGLVASLAGALAFAFAPNPWALVGARALTGLAACAWVGITVMFAGYFPANQSTRAIGWLNLANAAGQIIATWSGGQLAEAYGPIAPFVASAVTAGVGIALVAMCPEPVRARPGAGSASTKTASRLWKTATAPALIGVSLLSAVQNYASFSTVFGFTPVYAKELGATSSELGTLTALSLVPFAIAQPLTAGINARFGSRAVVVGGLLTIGLSAIATPACTTMVALLAVQVVAGFGRGVTGTTLMGLSIRHVASEERATAMGVYQAVYAIGMFLGPLVGGAVGDAAGLGAIFFSTGALQLGATIVAWRILNQRS